MKRSMIAVCLLLSSQSSVLACYEDHKAGAAWFDERTSRWSNDGFAAQAMQRDKLTLVSVVAGGSGVLILLGVFMRSLVNQARRAAIETLEPVSRVPLAIPNDRPPCEPLCIGRGLDLPDLAWEPASVPGFGDEASSGASFAVDSFSYVG